MWEKEEVKGKEKEKARISPKINRGGTDGRRMDRPLLLDPNLFSLFFFAGIQVFLVLLLLLLTWSPSVRTLPGTSPSAARRRCPPDRDRRPIRRRPNCRFPRGWRKTRVKKTNSQMSKKCFKIKFEFACLLTPSYSSAALALISLLQKK